MSPTPEKGTPKKAVYTPTVKDDREYMDALKRDFLDFVVSKPWLRDQLFLSSLQLLGVQDTHPRRPNYFLKYGYTPNGDNNDSFVMFSNKRVMERVDMEGYYTLMEHQGYKLKKTEAQKHRNNRDSFLKEALTPDATGLPKFFVKYDVKKEMVEDINAGLGALQLGDAGPPAPPVGPAVDLEDEIAEDEKEGEEN